MKLFLKTSTAYQACNWVNIHNLADQVVSIALVDTMAYIYYRAEVEIKD